MTSGTTKFDTIIQAYTGSTGAPSIIFSDTDTTTGLYRSNTNSIGFATSAVERLTIDSSLNVNTDMNVNNNFTMTNPTTDILSSTSGNITLGGNLDIDSNGWTSSVQPLLIVTQSGSQSIGTEATFTNWTTPTFNRGFTSFTSGVLTIAHDGIYQIAWDGTFTGNSSGRRIGRISKNGADTYANMTIWPTTANTLVFSGSAIVSLVTNDTLELKFFSSTTLDVTTAIMMVARLF